MEIADVIAGGGLYQGSSIFRLEGSSHYHLLLFPC